MLHSRVASFTPASGGSFGAWVGAKGAIFPLTLIPPKDRCCSNESGDATCVTSPGIYAVTARFATARLLLAARRRGHLVFRLGVIDLRRGHQVLHQLVDGFLGEGAADLVLALLEGGRDLHPRILDLDDVPAELALHRGLADIAALHGEGRVGEL